MRAHSITIFFFLTSFKLQFTTQVEPKCSYTTSVSAKTRRILHQPLFPATFAPPPSPPPPPAPDFPDQDQPFINELPTGSPATPYQTLPQPPPPPAARTTAAANPLATHPPPSPAKKVAVAVASAVLTLGMLSAMAFYLYKHRQAHSDGARKLFDESPQRTINEQSTLPPPSFLRTTEPPPPPPSAGISIHPTSTAAAGSPYRKLNHAKGLDPRPPPPPAGLLHSPPPMSSSDDDENPENSFSYTPPAKPSDQNRLSYSIPHSKRTSPKSRFSPSPPIKQSPPLPSSPASPLGPPQPSRTLKYSPKRAKSSPSPEMERRHSLSKIPIPPPPPPLSVTRNSWAAKTVMRQMTRPQSKSPSPKASPIAKMITRPVEDIDRDGLRPKMMGLHWDIVGPTSDTGTVWDQLESSSFQLSEDAMESLFGHSSANPVPKEAARKFVFPSFEQQNRILDSKKSQNIAILLRALNVTRDEVCEVLLDGNPEGLGPEIFETLVKMAPSKDEEIKLKTYDDGSSKLGPAERFLRAMLDIPFAFKRVEALLYRSNFGTEVEYLRKSFQTLEEASEELKNSRLFLKLLEAVLRTGNRMNDGTNRGSAKAFKLDTLLKLVDIKGTDGKTTLLHFVVQEIIRSEGSNSNPKTSDLKFNEDDDDDFKKQGLKIVSGLSRELGNVKKAATMDSDVLSGYVLKLEQGLQKIRHVLQHESQCKFLDSMNLFFKEAADEIARVKAEEKKALSLVREVTHYFHGDAAKRDLRPLRIFVIVRDFLSVLDNVCKDVGRMQDQTAIGAGRSFRISANASSLPVLISRYNVMVNDRSSDDDSM